MTTADVKDYSWKLVIILVYVLPVNIPKLVNHSIKEMILRKKKPFLSFIHSFVYDIRVKTLYNKIMADDKSSLFAEKSAPLLYNLFIRMTFLMIESSSMR